MIPVKVVLLFEFGSKYDVFVGGRVSMDKQRLQQLKELHQAGGVLKCLCILLSLNVKVWVIAVDVHASLLPGFCCPIEAYDRGLFDRLILIVLPEEI